jgi:hypothetical protein
MTRDKRLIFRFAVAGFVIATLAAFSMVFHAPNVITKPDDSGSALAYGFSQLWHGATW